MLKFMTGLMAMLMAVAVFATPAAAQSTYKVHTGDTLQLEVVEDGSLNRSLLVLPDGSVSVPMVGSIPAAGRSLADLKASITAGLAPSFATSPTVFVSVAKLSTPSGGSRSGSSSAAGMSIYVMGEIAKPGKIDVAPGTTLLQALAVGGGLTKFGAPKRIQLHRTDSSGQTVIYNYNYGAAMSGVAQPTIVLQSGDVIVVPARMLFE